MERALLGAGIKKSQIALINLHGTGTPLNDTAEARIFDDYFDDPAVKPLATANKGAIGHTLGAAGVLETIATIRALQDACVPQTIGNDQKESADVGLASHLVLGTPRTLERQGVGLNVNAAFGGHNSCIVVSLDHQEVEEVPTETVGVCIDRVGIAGANGDDVTRWRAIADGGGRAEANFGPSEVERPDFVPRSDWRTFDRLTQLTVLTSAQVTSYIPPDERDNVAFLFATERGPSDAVDELLARTRAGKRLNPMLFGRLAFTHCAGAVTQQLELRGPTMTFTAGRLGGLAALQYGLCLIRRGICDRAVVVATDTVSDHVRASPKYVRKPIDGARLAECSIAFLLTRSPASGTGVVRTVCLGRSEPAPLWHGPCDPLTWLRLIDTALGRSSMNADSVGTYAIASATERGSSDAVNIAVKARSRAGAMILDPSAAFGDVGAASSFLPYVIDRVVEPMKAVVEPLLICQHDASGLLGVALIE
jgi:3-oxoacyl-[acyl-carrier-protein] synthase II